ncbi:MAG TPA: hypothetical protein VJ804_09465 [Acidimicrobiales bacterium]|nr:hypothetical protein [Acidimicrobiales bacterium]
MPDLRPPSTSGDPAAFLSAAGAAAPGVWRRPLVVGHSGAGFFLSSIAATVGAAHTVYVDAGLAPGPGRHMPGADFLGQLRDLTEDGVLRPWSTWWGEGTMRFLIPDDERRRVVEQELPRVPLRFYETAVELSAPTGSSESSYVLLSETYRPEAERAVELGWTVTVRLGGHLDLVNDPQPIAAALEAVL